MNSVGGTSTTANNSTCGSASIAKSNTEANDDEFGFFPREPSDSGLLEEVVHKFLSKSKPSEYETAAPPLSQQPQAQPSMPDPMFVSSTQCYNDNRSELPMKEGLGVSFDHQGFPMQQQFESFTHGLTFNSVQDMPFGNHQLMMNDADFSMAQDIVGCQEFLNAFAPRIQNA